MAHIRCQNWRLCKTVHR